MEDALVFVGSGVRRIEENDVEGGRAGGFVLDEFFESVEGVAGKDLKARVHAKAREIFPDQFEGGLVPFEKNRFLGAAAQGFDADGARSREDIEEVRAFDHRTEDVKESFPEAVARGPEFAALERPDLAAAEFSGDDAHSYAIRAR